MPESVNACYLCGSSQTRLFFTRDSWRLVRCQSCGLVYLNPRPSAEELRCLYSSEGGYHEQLMHDASIQSWAKTRAQGQIAQVARFRPTPGRLLDVGCGTGVFLCAVAARGWETVGVELSPDTAEYTRRMHGLEVVTGTLEEAAFPDDHFDVVTLWDVLEHVPDPRGDLWEIGRILRPNGLVFIVCPNIDGLLPRITRIVFGKSLGFWEHDQIPYHLYEFAQPTLRRLLEWAGFAILELRTEEIPLSDFYETGKLVYGRRKIAKGVLRFIYRGVFATVYPIARWRKMGNQLLAVSQVIRRASTLSTKASPTQP